MNEIKVHFDSFYFANFILFTPEKEFQGVRTVLFNHPESERISDEFPHSKRVDLVPIDTKREEHRSLILSPSFTDVILYEPTESGVKAHNLGNTVPPCVKKHLIDQSGTFGYCAEYNFAYPVITEVEIPSITFDTYFEAFCESTGKHVLFSVPDLALAQLVARQLFDIEARTPSPVSKDALRKSTALDHFSHLYVADGQYNIGYQTLSSGRVFSGDSLKQFLLKQQDAHPT